MSSGSQQAPSTSMSSSSSVGLPGMPVDEPPLKKSKSSGLEEALETLMDEEALDTLMDEMDKPDDASSALPKDGLSALLSQCQAHSQFQTFVTHHMSTNELSPADWEFGRNHPYEDVVAFHHWCTSSGLPSVVDLDLLRQADAEVVKQMVDDEPTMKSQESKDDMVKESEACQKLEHQTKQADTIDGTPPPTLANTNTHQHTSQPAATNIQQQDQQDPPNIATERSATDPADKTINTPEQTTAEKPAKTETEKEGAPLAEAMMTRAENTCTKRGTTDTASHEGNANPKQGTTTATVLQEGNVQTKKEDTSLTQAKMTTESTKEDTQTEEGTIATALQEETPKTKDASLTPAKMTTEEDTQARDWQEENAKQEDVQHVDETLAPEPGEQHMDDTHVHQVCTTLPVVLNDLIIASKKHDHFAEFLAMDSSSTGIDEWGTNDARADLQRYNEFLISKNLPPWDLSNFPLDGSAESDEAEAEKIVSEKEESDESEGESRINFQYPLAPTADHPQIKCVLRSAAKVGFDGCSLQIKNFMCFSFEVWMKLCFGFDDSMNQNNN